MVLSNYEEDMIMDLKKEKKKRHMVRKYIDKSLPDDLINRINESR